MRRTILSLAAALCLSLVLGGVASAQTTYPPPDGGSPAVEAGSGSQDGTAFTGSDMTFPMVAAGGLLVLGAATLVVARRRARVLQGY